MTFEDWVRLVLQSNLLAAFVVGGFGLLTLRLGLGKFRSEKWWERKAVAYASAIEALHGMHDLAHIRMEAEELSEDIPADRLRSLAAISQAGLSEIRRGANIGSFVMSKRSVYHRTRGYRAHRAPGIPCALRLGRAERQGKTRPKTRGEIAKLCLRLPAV